MKGFLAVVLILAISSVAFGYEYAWCQFQGTSFNPGLTGYAYFQTSSTPNAIDMYVSVSGITQNDGVAHGIHIHQFGDISDTLAALNVGSHYDPAGSSHGCPDQGSAQWHEGDTGNWNVTGGVITGNKTLTSPKLSGINSIIGRAVIIHNRTDDCTSTTSSQSRLGYCVIGIANPAYSTVNTTGNDASSGATSVSVGVCDLQQINFSGVTGRVWLTPFASGVQVDAIIYNLTGTHGFHIHQYGDLRLTDTGNSTGGHYNPFNINHGIPPYETRHLGDMGNIYYSVNATTMAYSYNFSINGNAPVISLTGTNNVIGRAIVIHSSPDNCSQPTGGSGSRVAFCVIGIGNTTAISPIGNYPSVPTTQNDTLCLLLASPSPTASPSIGASASSSPNPGASASSSPGSMGASASPSPDGNDSLGSVVVPYFVAVVSMLVVLILAF